MAEDDLYRLPGDQSNPYAPPEAELTPLGPRGELTFLDGDAPPFSIPGALEMGTRLFRERAGLAIGVMLATLAINVLVQLAILAALGALQAGGASPIAVVASQVGFTLLGYVEQFWLWAGVIAVLLKVARGEPASFDEMFKGGRFLVRFFLVALLLFAGFMIVVFLLAMVAGFVIAAIQAGGGGNNGAVPTTLAVVFVGFGLVLFFYLWARLGQFPFVMVDRNAGMFESLGHSLELTRGRTVEMIGFNVVCSLVSMVGVLACVVGVIVTMPLSALILTSGYVMLNGGAAGRNARWVPPALRDDLQFPEFEP